MCLHVLQCAYKYSVLITYFSNVTQMTVDLSRVGDRNKLKSRREPYWHRLRIGCFIGFRPSRVGKAGTWIARVLNQEANKYKMQSLGDLGKYTRNEMFAVAKQMAEQLAEKVECGGNPDLVIDTVADACRHYANRKPEAESRFRRHVYSEPIARITLKKLRRHHLREWRNALSEKPVRRNNRSAKPNKRAASTLNRDMVVLRAALNQVLAKGPPNTDAAWQEALKPIPNADGQRSLYLDKCQRNDLLTYADNEVLPFIQTLCLLPLRVGAVAKLRVRDFDQRTNELTIGQDKNGKPRRLKIPNAASKIFTTQTQGKLSDQPIFERKNGKAWDKDSWKKPISKAVSLANLPSEATAYTLRHSVITDLVQQNLPLLTIAQISGTSVEMIEKHYGHLQNSAALDALDAISVL
jgi:integrase